MKYSIKIFLIDAENHLIMMDYGIATRNFKWVEMIHLNLRLNIYKSSCKKRLAHASIIKKSVIFFVLINMTI